MQRMCLFVLTGLTLGACAPAPAGTGAPGETATARRALPGPPVALESVPQEPAPACDATRARFAIGQSDSDALAERARIAAGAGIVRRLSPGQAATMDFRADRLNLDSDDARRIVGVRCG